MLISYVALPRWLGIITDISYANVKHELDVIGDTDSILVFDFHLFYFLTFQIIFLMMFQMIIITSLQAVVVFLFFIPGFILVSFPGCFLAILLLPFFLFFLWYL